MPVLSRISNGQGLGREKKHEMLKTDRILSLLLFALLCLCLVLLCLLDAQFVFLRFEIMKTDRNHLTLSERRGASSPGWRTG